MNLESIKNIIRGLMDKTIERGCTEAEANSAMIKVQQLMETYQIGMDDIFISDTKCIKIELVNNKNVPYVGIARFTNTKVWRDGKKIFFFGLEPDVIMAEYLCKLIENSINYELENFKKSELYQSYQLHKRRLTTSFYHGMSTKLFNRLNTMHEELNNSERFSSSVRAMIIVKNQKVEDEFQQMNLRLRTVRKQRRTSNREAFGRGVEAGDKVNLNRPIGGKVSGHLC